MDKDVIIRVDGLWKRYGLPLPRFYYKGKKWLRSLRNTVVDSPQSDDGPWALHDVSFEIKRGESIGIIGRNGAGKTTLLKVLAGVTPPTRGTVDLYGRIFPMIELNAGIHSDLTGRENVYLLGAIMGLHRREIAAKMPEIEDFCELGEWFEQPVRKYSSGMLARLGFAIAMYVDADVLLIDEVLAVGDITFQRKSLDRMERLQESGKTIIFVSHSLRQVERLCNKTILLEKGDQIAFGNTMDVISKYYESANITVMEQYLSSGEKVRLLQDKIGNAVIDITKIRLLDKNGKEQTTFYTGDPLTFEVEYYAHELIAEPIISLAISTIDLLYITGFTNEGVDFQIPLHGHGKFYCTIPSLTLLHGIYVIQSKIKHPNGAILGGGNSLAVFSVIVPAERRLSSDYGIVTMDTYWHRPEQV